MFWYNLKKQELSGTFMVCLIYRLKYALNTLVVISERSAIFHQHFNRQYLIDVISICGWKGAYFKMIGILNYIWLNVKLIHAFDLNNHLQGYTSNTFWLISISSSIIEKWEKLTFLYFKHFYVRLSIFFTINCGTYQKDLRAINKQNKMIHRITNNKISHKELPAQYK